MVSQEAIILSGFCLLFVLFHISQLIALFISVYFCNTGQIGVIFASSPKKAPFIHFAIKHIGLS